MTGWILVSYVLLWVLVIAVVIVCLGLMRQLGALHLRLDHQPRPLADGPEVGGALSPFVETDEISGDTYRFPLEDRRATLLILVSPYCGICEETLEGLMEEELPADVGVVVVSDGEAAETVGHRARVRAPVRFTTSNERQVSFGAQLIPFGFVVDGAGRVLAKQTVNGPREVRQLVANLNEVAATSSTV